MAFDTRVTTRNPGAGLKGEDASSTLSHPPLQQEQEAARPVVRGSSSAPVMHVDLTNRREIDVVSSIELSSPSFLSQSALSALDGQRSYVADSKTVAKGWSHQMVVTPDAIESHPGIRSPIAASVISQSLSATTPVVAGTVTESSQAASRNRTMHKWEAFLDQHERVVRFRIQAGDLRRRCIAGRQEVRKLQSEQYQHPLGSLHDSRSISAPSDRVQALADAIEGLEVNEQRLDELDQMIITEEEQMTRAAPRVLSQMQEALLPMIERHQLDYRGDASTSANTNSTDLEDALDATAAAMAQRQERGDSLENEVLVYRAQRNKLLETIGDSTDEQSSTDEEQVHEDRSRLQELDGFIETRLNQLSSLRADMERVRDQAISDSMDIIGHASAMGARLMRLDMTADVSSTDVTVGASSISAATITGRTLSTHTSTTLPWSPRHPGAGSSVKSSTPESSSGYDQGDTSFKLSE